MRWTWLVNRRHKQGLHLKSNLTVSVMSRLGNEGCFNYHHVNDLQFGPESNTKSLKAKGHLYVTNNQREHRGPFSVGPGASYFNRGCKNHVSSRTKYLGIADFTIYSVLLKWKLFILLPNKTQHCQRRRLVPWFRNSLQPVKKEVSISCITSHILIWSIMEINM